MQSKISKNTKPSLVWHFPHLMFWMGGTKYLFNICKELQREFEVVIVTNTGDPLIIKRFVSSGISVKTTSYLATNSILYWLFFPVLFFFDLAKSWKYLKNSQILICTAFPSNLICAVYSMIENRSFHFLCFEPFMFFHNKEYISSLPIIKKLLVRFLSLLYGWIDIWSSHRAKTITTIDSYKATLIEQIYKIKPHNIGTGIDTSFFYKRNVDRLTKIYGNVPVIFHATDYTPLKGTTDALHIFKIVHDHNPNALLLISSTQPNSPNKRTYEKLVIDLKLQNSVHLVGLIPEKDLPLYYSFATCYLSTSSDPMTATNLPVKEALACQTPALRALPSSGDVINDKSGYLINPKIHETVAIKIIKLIENPNLRKSMGIYGRKLIEMKYNWERTASLLVDITHFK